MTLFTRSMLALTISLSLVACSDNGDNKSVEEEDLLPLPPQQVSLEIGDATVQALEESVVVTSVDGDQELTTIEAFKGIDYATSTRLVHSEVKSFEGEIDATGFGAACPQSATTLQVQSEDCLNLNIWRPADATNLPVYVFIHGGDFETGAGSEPLIHADTVVAQGVLENEPFIAVTFNYRLGLLGSMWVDEAQSGNFGLGDQKRALEWVNENISDFGGDSTNVTLMGQGAGAMSIGFLQQTETEEVVTGNYFQRAIMQSNPYGFEYRGYDVAKSFVSDLDVDQLRDIDAYPLADIMLIQEDLLNPVSKLINWLSMSIEVPLVSVDNTPIAAFMPFSPYIEYRARDGILKPEKLGYHTKEQPSQSDFSVPTVLGVNSEESNSFGMLPSLTFLIPTILGLIEDSDLDLGDPESVGQAVYEWLDDDSNAALAIDEISSPGTDSLVSDILACIGLETQEEVLQCVATLIPSTAYEAVTKLFFGLGNTDITEGTAEAPGLLKLTDFFPNPERELSGALANMSQYKTILNDMLFTGPARLKAQQTSESVALYYFGYHASFNVWSYDLSGDIGATEIIDVIKAVGCVSGACNASELPFVFNKAYKIDRTTVSPTAKDRTLMAKMSRLWFSDALFTDYAYSASTDNVLDIDEEGEISVIDDWDLSNEGIDPALREGRLNGLNDLGLILGYMD
ncbi:carboxylesterase family protein [Psychromonas marina]|nr:carboxylesterase family protein [Psychromonas marina]